MTDTHQIEAWLDRLDTALRGKLPDGERKDIVDETRAHLLDLTRQGVDEDQALSGFGDASAYARAFIDDRALNNALQSQRSFHMAKVLFQIARRSVIASVGLMLFLLFGGIAIGAAVSIVLKIIAPDKVGMWVGPGDRFILGAPAQITSMHEVMGANVYFLFAAMLVAGLLLARYSLVLTIKGVRGRRLIGA
ncbi:MAG: HAAS signaling domain-containing protein [Asticcacaulis sp.]